MEHEDITAPDENGRRHGSTAGNVHADGGGQIFDFRAHIAAISGYRQSDLKQISVTAAGR
jgi:hypothetical protein